VHLIGSPRTLSEVERTKGAVVLRKRLYASGTSTPLTAGPTRIRRIAMRNSCRNDKMCLLDACDLNLRRTSWLEVSKEAIERRSRKKRGSKRSRRHRVKRVQRQAGVPTWVLTKGSRKYRSIFVASKRDRFLQIAGRHLRETRNRRDRGFVPVRILKTKKSRKNLGEGASI
jgi:hypothetical protein